jgi:hypothetical protein
MQMAVAKTALIYKRQPKGAGHEADDALSISDL